MKKSIALCVFSIFVILAFAGNIFAITGAIGNARMVLRMEKGEKAEKYILVRNVNNVSLEIELSAEGDLKNSIKIKDTKFSLGVGDEKKAAFTITASKDGTSESRINVKFTPTDGKNGVGLSSTIIVVTGNGTGSNEDLFEENTDSSSEDSNKTSIINSIKEKLGNTGSGNTGALIFLTFITFIAFVVLLVLLFIKKNKVQKKEAENASEIKIKKKVKRDE
jgi:hypothetical protein